MRERKHSSVIGEGLTFMRPWVQAPTGTYTQIKCKKDG